MKSFNEYHQETLTEGISLLFPKALGLTRFTKIKSLTKKINNAGDIEEKIELLAEQNESLGEMMAATLIALEKMK